MPAMATTSLCSRQARAACSSNALICVSLGREIDACATSRCTFSSSPGHFSCCAYAAPLNPASRAIANPNCLMNMACVVSSSKNTRTAPAIPGWRVHQDRRPIRASRYRTQCRSADRFVAVGLGNSSPSGSFVAPAKAGAQRNRTPPAWVPAIAGTTEIEILSEPIMLWSAPSRAEHLLQILEPGLIDSLDRLPRFRFGSARRRELARPLDRRALSVLAHLER